MKNTLDKTTIEVIAQKGSAIYEEIKKNYEPQHIGKFLAINTDSRDVYMAETSADAVARAKFVHPNKVFYVVKIGFSAVEVLSSLRRLQHA